MTEASIIPSLEKFRLALEARCALLDGCIDEDLLSKLKPTPYDAFQRALDIDGAKEQDINAFLESLKAWKVGRSKMLTKDGLVFLSNTVWQLSFEVSPVLRLRSPIAAS
jgi:hypothetical protein